MTEEQIIIVKKTWKMFRGVDPSVIGDTFYSKLFADHPALRKMFPHNLEEQYKKLMYMLNIIVGRLEKMEELNHEIMAMGQRHVGYGVRPSHYRLVGDALLWTLKQGLGRDWTPEVEQAWARCYGVVAERMMGDS